VLTSEVPGSSPSPTGCPQPAPALGLTSVSVWSDARLEPPAADWSKLVRERLLDRLRRRWVAPVVVVTAPAGYGKTTLLSQAISENAVAPLGIDCWLACGPGLATVSSLGSALCQAVGATGAGQGDVHGLATRIAEGMWRRSPQQVALLLDDVHEIPVGSDAAEVLAAIMESLPANGHLVLAGRVAPPVPLARMDVEGRVVRVDEAELAFTESELAEFAALRNVASARVAGCGGWPALAELFASARPGAMSDYVAEEVLPQLPAERRHAIARLAYLGEVDDDLARTVLGQDVDISELLAGIPLVESRASGARSLHALWQSLLASELSAEDVADVRRRAGVALLARGRVDRAMRLLIEAGAWKDIGRAIVVVSGAAHPPVARDVLEDWFGRLPGEAKASPSGRLLAAVIGVEGDLGGAWQDFEECATAFRSVDETTGELACLVQLGQVAWWSDWPDRLAAVAARAFELEAQGCEGAAPFACLGRAMLFDIADDSRQMLAELDRIPAGSLSEPWLGLVSWARAIALLQLGHPAAAQDAAERAMTYAGTLHAPLAEGTRLQARWYQGHLAEVHDALPALLERVRESGYRNSTVLFAAVCSVAHAFRAQPDQAARYLEQARGTAHLVPDTPLIDTNLAVAEAMLALASGDEADASAVLTAYVDRHPVGVGLPVAAQRRHLALFYVLVPSTRPVWERADLGSAWRVARELAQLLTAVRAHDGWPASAPPLDDAAIVLAHLPPAWAAEVGIAAIAAGRDDGWKLLDASWPITRAMVAELARSGVGTGRGAASGKVGDRRRKAAREVLGRLPVPPTARLDLRLLGPVELSSNDVPVRGPGWGRERVRSLLAYLVLHGTVSRGQAADDLWPALEPDAQSANLRVTLTYLLRVLEPDRASRDASFFVRQDGGNLSLHAENWLAVDVWSFDALCDEAMEADRRGAPATSLDRILQAVELWRGEPTELLSEHWAVPLLEQLRRRFATMATRGGELLLGQGRLDQAHALAEQALAIDPWLEGPHRLVVATHRAAGDDLAARGALSRYRAAIHDLGLSPDEATLMVERLLDQVTALPRPG
jgi:LuxR family maltose regulon positive regulatory protein